jgi:hypothetical protein
MARTERIELIRRIEQRRNSRVICCLTSDRQNAHGIISKDFIPIFYENLSAFSNAGNFSGTTNVDVFLFTPGGDTLAAFGLSRLLREFTSSVNVLIAEKCHSAGTLFALGASKIFMTKAATLTPIDPSITSPLNPVVEPVPGQRQLLPVSVESVAGYQTLVKEDWRLSKEAVGLAFRMLAERVNPLALGDVYRSRQQIERLACTLLGNHRKDDRNIRRIVEKLTRGYGSHDYLLSRTEARELLGSQVGAEDIELEGLIWQLYRDFAADMSLGEVFDAGIVLHAARAAGRPLPVLEQQKVVVIETTSGGNLYERVLQLSLSQVMTPAGPLQVPQGVVVRAGWARYT